MSAARRRERRRAEWPLPERVGAFLWRYVRLRPWHFGGLLLLVVGAATCAVAVQYGMKLLVDAMADPARRAAVTPSLMESKVIFALDKMLLRMRYPSEPVQTSCKTCTKRRGWENSSPI